MSEIDIVITWVDSSDPAWIKEYNKYCPNEKKEIDVSEKRFRDLGLLKYWFRGVELYAPWVRKIHFVTSGQVPSWLNTKNSKLNLVKHNDYIPQKYLPIFNSHPIELMFHNIPDLAEKFIYFNDDFYLIGDVKPEFFFKNELPVDCGALSIVNPLCKISSIIYNNLNVINKKFTKKSFKGKRISFNYDFIDNVKSILLAPFPFIAGFLDTHCAIAYEKKTFEEVWSSCEDVLLQTMGSRFRSLADVNHWLFRYWRIAKGDFIPTNIRKGIKVCNINDNRITQFILLKKYKELVINDDECLDFDKRVSTIAVAFEELLPNKSSFEK